jgi:outer membrane lipoprotein SlyB
MNFTKISSALVLSAFLAACASSNSGDVYSRDETRRVQTVKTGIVESVRTVKIEGTKSAVGTGAGAVVGGVAGGAIGGSGKSEVVGAVIGAVVGGLAGAAAEEGLTRKDGLEITVKLDSGGLIAIVQEATEQFQPGESVRIIEQGGVSRVSH